MQAVKLPCRDGATRGVLTITLSKSEQARARQIPVRGAGRQTIEGQMAGQGAAGEQSVLQGESNTANRLTTGATGANGNRTGTSGKGTAGRQTAQRPPPETQRMQRSGAEASTTKTTRSKR